MTSSSSDPRQEVANTYFVQDRANTDELTRIQLQDRMLTTSMGGVLPEQPDTLRFRRVLDVGCGTGGWLIEVAKAHPEAELLIGVDANRNMVEVARHAAEAEGVSTRVDFHVMDALRMLEFSDGFFDLVNHRLGIGWIRTWDWHKLLQEYQRVARAGGIIRITEADILVTSTSPTLTQLSTLFLEAFYQAGHLFEQKRDGLTSALKPVMEQHGIQQVQTRLHPLEYRGGSPEGQLYIEDTKHFCKSIVPFLRKWTRVPDDYDALYQQMVQEIEQPDFVSVFPFTTAWGTNPSRAK